MPDIKYTEYKVISMPDIKYTEYNGKLAENRRILPKPQIGATFLLDEEAKATAKYSSDYNKMYMDYCIEDFNNLFLLCDHYGIERATKDETGASYILMFSRLSIKLAEELKVPAFTEENEE